MGRRSFLSVLGGATVYRSNSVSGRVSSVHSPTDDRLIGAHYYPWYGPDRHWSNGYRGTPRLGEYDSRSKRIVKHHLEWASDAGIDWFNVSWWGPNSYSGETLQEDIAPVIGDSSIEFSVLYEPKGRLEYENGVASFDAPTNRETLATDFKYIANDLVDTSNYLHVAGRPVLYIYIAHSLSGDVDGAFADAQAHAETDFYLIGDFGRNPQLPTSPFDAISPYNMYHPVADVGDGFVENVQSTYERWHLLAEEMDFQFIPVVLPGFDNTNAAWAPDGMPVLERTPARYRELCGVARRYMDSDLEMALITSFNEWHDIRR